MDTGSRKLHPCVKGRRDLEAVCRVDGWMFCRRQRGHIMMLFGGGCRVCLRTSLGEERVLLTAARDRILSLIWKPAPASPRVGDASMQLWQLPHRDDRGHGCIQSARAAPRLCHREIIQVFPSTLHAEHFIPPRSLRPSRAK
jgi:hypothetical protein